MINNACSCQNTSLGNVWADCFIEGEKQNQSGCIFSNKLNFFREQLVNKCEKYCPLECETVSYSVGFSMYNAINRTEVFVYYESLKYTSITQIAKSKEFDLISNIGGILGLFIGVSFVTLFEIGEMFIDISLMIPQNNNCFCKKKIRPQFALK